MMTGGITRFLQANDTNLCQHLTETTLMLKKLEIDKNKDLRQICEKIILMLLAALRRTVLDFTAVFDTLFVTNVFDGSEDVLVSNKLVSLTGGFILEHQRDLFNSEVLVISITRHST